MKVSLDISAPSRLWRGLPRARAIARETIAAAAAESGGVVRDGAVVSLCLADDAALRALNSRWRGVDKPTNVLSFPSPPPGPLGDAPTLGDIALAYETLAREAEDLGVPLADHYRHLRRPWISAPDRLRSRDGRGGGAHGGARDKDSGAARGG